MRLLIALAFSSCSFATLAAAPAQEAPLATPAIAPQAEAKVQVMRDRNAPNACDVELYLNQQVVAKLGPGEQFTLDLPSGASSLAVAISPAGYCGGRGPEAEQSVLLRPGETQYYSIRIETDQVFLAPLPAP